MRYLGDLTWKRIIEDENADLQTRSRSSIVEEHHILLEFGDYDLHNYCMAISFPLVLQAEIEQFWEEFVQLADGLRRIHDLDIELDGKRRRANV